LKTAEYPALIVGRFSNEQGNPTRGRRQVRRNRAADPEQTEKAIQKAESHDQHR
jgi:hypothetical protein